MTTGSEISTALHGVWRLARFDRRGMAFFDRSVGGFWRSYRAALIVYPMFLILLALSSGSGSDFDGQSADWFRIVLVETIGFVIAWTAFPLVMLPVTRFLGREERWLDYIIAYNWMHVLQAGLLVANFLLAASGLLPVLLHGFIALATLLAVLIYTWFVARVALDTSGIAATMIVLIEQVLALLVSTTTQALH